MYSQLDNSSWRWSEAYALHDAEEEYGTNCETPFSRNIFNMSGTSSFFCSKLVWRVYLDNGHYSVDVDSNHWSYFLWLLTRYGMEVALFVLYGTVAPDEIAKSSHLDNYRELDLD